MPARVRGHAAVGRRRATATALPLDALECLFDSALDRGRATRLAALRAPSFPAGPAAARGRRGSDAAHPRGLHVRSEGDDGRRRRSRRVSAAARRLSGLRPAGDRLPAVARACRRATSAATWRRCRRRARRASPARTPRMPGSRSTVRASAGSTSIPTNNLLPSTTHVTLAWGRDYADVSPIRGVILGGGQHSLHVSVDVLRLAED